MVPDLLALGALGAHRDLDAVRALDGAGMGMTGPPDGIMAALAIP